MIDFGYHVTAGTVLVIDAVQSPNFVAGSSGWIIRQDGTVEFANATIRGVFEADGANNSFVRVTTTGGTGFGTALLMLRPPDLPNIASAEIVQAQLFALSFQPGGAGVVPSAYLSTELDCAQWASGSTAVDKRYPVLVMQTASHDGTVHPSVTVTTGGAATVPSTFDVTLAANLNVSSGRLKGGANCMLSVAPAVVMASGTVANLQTMNSLDDAYSMFDGASTVTLPYTGTYRIEYFATFSAQAVAAGYRSTQVALNGGTFRRMKMPTSASVNSEIIGVPMAFSQEFFAGDQLTFLAHQNSGGNLNFSADIFVELVRPTT